MDHKEHMTTQAKLLTSMDVDEIFAKAEVAVDMAGSEAIEAARGDAEEASGLTLTDDVVRQLLVCGFSLALTMAQRAAENFLHKGE
jgi:hypothetical protein